MYNVIFEDGSVFEGGEITNSKWNEMPDKAIKILEYPFETRELIFEGFESYNHLIEKIQVIQHNENKLSKIIILAKHEDKIIQIHYDLETRELSKHSGEYNGRQTTGWKRGVKGKPSILYT